MSQTESYLRQLQNAYAELISAYKRLETLEERRADTGLVIGAEDVIPFSHLTVDNVTNAQFTFTQIKAVLDNGHRANINKVIP